MGMGAEMMSKVLFAALVCSMLQAAVCSQAWSEFTTSKKAPTGSRRLMAAGLGNKNSVTVPVQPIMCGSKPCPDASAQKSFVTVNSFISEGKTGKPTDAAAQKAQEKAIQERIYKLCSQGAPGTSFSYLAQTDWQKGATTGKVADPLCYYCLSKGYGVDESTPGYYLPCGCQRTCVDVSGYSVGSYQSMQAGKEQFFGLGNKKTFPYLSNSIGINGVYGTGGKTPTWGQPLKTCQDYIDNKMVTTCNEIYIYHFVLWPSVLGIMAMLYAVYSIAFMSLDMDSLLYTVGSSHKKSD